MNIVFQITSVVINLIVFFINSNRIKQKFDIKIIALMIFQIVYVVPIVNNWVFSLPNFSYKYPVYQEALEDKNTDFLYSIFTIVVPLILNFYIKKHKGKVNNFIDLKDIVKNMKINRNIFLLSIILMYLPLILILFSPSPDKYFTYAYFQKYSYLATSAELWYHFKIMKIAQIISLISILIVRNFGKRDVVNSILIYTAAISTGLINGKRTIFAMILLAILVVDILKAPKGKFPFVRAFITFVSIVSFFVLYANLINKHTYSFSQLDDLRLYFFRDFDVKMSLYCLLYPEKQKILDFWGQSYLYNITFYVPRSLWENKPYPYAYYATSASLGYSEPILLKWTVQTSFFGELIANFHLLGIPVGIWMMNLFIDVSQRTYNSVIILLSMFIVIFSFLNHFIAFAYYFVFWLVLYCYHNFKRRTRRV